MDYRNLGRSGVKVSPLCLGAWQFGQRSSEEESFRLIDIALERGLNFLDTANVYGSGLSETVIGKAFQANGQRHRWFLATKFMGSMDAADPNARGVSRHHIVEACEASLRRLQTDYIDLYQFHDPNSQAGIPIDESLRALDDLVRAGKVRYLGTSNFSAWHLVESLWAAKEYGLNRPISEQPAYNLLDRRAEREVIPMARSYDLAILPWSPLAQGFLTGKYRRGETQPADTRLAAGVSANSGEHAVERAFDLVEVLESLAQEKNIPVSQLSLAWCIQQPGITSAIIGPRTLEQLEDNLAALDVKLTEEDFQRIDAVSPPGEMIVDYFRANRAVRARWI